MIPLRAVGGAQPSMNPIRFLGLPGNLSKDEFAGTLTDAAEYVARGLGRGATLGRISAGLPRDQLGGLAEKAGHAPACRRGCAACCVHAVQVAPIEALNLAGYLRATRTPLQLASLRQRLADRIATIGAADRDKDGALLTWRSPCALLAPDLTCSVYAHRPIACVGYHSLDAAACADPQGGHPFVGPQVQASAALVGGVQAGCAAVGLDGEPVELTVALAAALEDPAIERRWRAKERVFAAARAQEGRDGGTALAHFADAQPGCHRVEIDRPWGDREACRMTDDLVSARLARAAAAPSIPPADRADSASEQGAPGAPDRAQRSGPAAPPGARASQPVPGA